MNLRFLLFFSVITLFLLVSGFYLGVRIITRTQFGDANRALVWFSLALLIALQLLGPYLYRAYPSATNKMFILHWVSYMTLGVFVCLLFYTSLSDLIGYVCKFFLSADQHIDFDRRNFLLTGFIALGSAGVGVLQAKSGPKIYDVEVPIEGLPKEWEGLRIVQVSDLHVGPTITGTYVEAVVKQVNALQPDIVALTGDFIDGRVEDLGEDLLPLKEIQSTYGLFFVTGNHEYYWGVEPWLNFFREMKVKVLMNEHIVLNRGGFPLVLAGVTDYTASSMIPSHRSDPIKAAKGAPESAVKILLAHQPKSFELAEKAGFHLQLSGHTHAGQFFPFNLLVRMVQPYYKGLNRFRNLWIYVNRGTGYWGPPIRFAVPSEITNLTLKRG